MFGYVVANQEQMTPEQETLYRGYYCGLCRSLKKQFGNLGRLTLNYDMTFMVLLLADLEDAETTSTERRCVVHPAKKRRMMGDEVIDYGAAMNILLAYYNMIDDWEDDHNTVSRAGAAGLKPHIAKIAEKYPRQARAVEEGMKALRKEEDRGPRDLDTAANIFGELLGQLFVYRKDHWAGDCRQLGEALGHFVYWMDAYADLKKDLKKGSYNPLCLIYEEENFEDRVEEMLRGALGECALILERLPLVEHLDVLRNVIYSGVWTKYNAMHKNENSEGEKE